MHSTHTFLNVGTHFCLFLTCAFSSALILITPPTPIYPLSLSFSVSLSLNPPSTSILLMPPSSKHQHRWAFYFLPLIPPAPLPLPLSPRRRLLHGFCSPIQPGLSSCIHRDRWWSGESLSAGQPPITPLWPRSLLTHTWAHKHIQRNLLTCHMAWPMKG